MCRTPVAGSQPERTWNIDRACSHGWTVLDGLPMPADLKVGGSSPSERAGSETFAAARGVFLLIDLLAAALSSGRSFGRMGVESGSAPCWAVGLPKTNVGPVKLAERRGRARIGLAGQIPASTLLKCWRVRIARFAHRMSGLPGCWVAVMFITLSVLRRPVPGRAVCESWAETDRASASLAAS
jgi:hypothetical protein